MSLLCTFWSNCNLYAFSSWTEEQEICSYGLLTKGHPQASSESFLKGFILYRGHPWSTECTITWKSHGVLNACANYQLYVCLMHKSHTSDKTFLKPLETYILPASNKQHWTFSYDTNDAILHKNIYCAYTVALPTVTRTNTWWDFILFTINRLHESS
jgi:hypothetical protein